MTAQLSDAGVPAFWRRRAQAFAEPFEAIGYGQAGDVFDVLVAELPGNSQAKRSAERNGKLTAVHTEGQESLRMQGVSHIDAIPPVWLDRTVDNISGLGKSAHQV